MGMTCTGCTISAALRSNRHAARCQEIIKRALQRQWLIRADELREARTDRDYWRNEYETLMLLMSA